MAVLVDYLCGGCGVSTEFWAAPPVPTELPCPLCGGTGRRQFGGTLLGRGKTSGRQAPSAAGSHDSAVPGTCTLVPTASRMLQARLQGDGRRIEHETALQTRAIERGVLDPAGPLVTTLNSYAAAAPTSKGRPVGNAHVDES